METRQLATGVDKMTDIGSSTSSPSIASDMPIWLDDCSIDCEWVSQKTGIIGINECTAIDCSNVGRRGKAVRDGATLLLSLHIADSCNSIRLVIMKQVASDNQKSATLSRQLGLAREARFYSDLAPFLPSIQDYGLPKIWYSYGNNETGEKCIIMEYLDPTSWLDSGIFFGPGNPNNWSRDLTQMVKTAYGPKRDPPTSATVAMVTFRSIARIHAFFWKKDVLLLDPKFNWLRGHGWIQQNSRESWEASQNLIRNIWSKYCNEECDSNDSSGATKFNWKLRVRSAVEKAIASISWDDQITRLCVSGHWTLVHGDFWPGNVIWSINNNSSSNSDASQVDIDKCRDIRLLDWEMVGIGSGPQDLGQYVISNFAGQERRECERELIRAYHQELISAGLDNVSLDYCWKEYSIGGTERWIWFLVWFLGQGEAVPGWAQFFHDQIAEFMEDHGISEKDISQPRP